MTAATLPRGNELALAIRLRDLQIELDLVDVADNVRTVEDPEADAQLLASVRERGVLEPVGITLTPAGRYLLRYGHRRLRAARAAGLTTLPAVVVDEAPQERVFDQLVENIHRADLNALDVAKALRRALDETPKLTQAKLAERLGWAPSTLSNTLSILKAPDAVQQLLADGRIERAHVVAIKGLPSAKQVELATSAATHGLGAHALEEQVKWARDRQKELDARDADTAAAAQTGLKVLEEAGTEKNTTLLIRVPWNLDRTKVREVIAAAGHTVAAENVYGYDLHPGCDCTVMVLDLTAKRPTLSPGCVSEDHRQAAWKAQNAKRIEADEAKRQERRQLVDAAAAALTAAPIARPLAVLALRAFEGYAGKTWKAYADMSDADIAESLADRLFPPYDQGKPLPHDKVLAELKAITTAAAS